MRFFLSTGKFGWHLVEGLGEAYVVEDLDDGLVDLFARQFSFVSDQGEFQVGADVHAVVEGAALEGKTDLAPKGAQLAGAEAVDLASEYAHAALVGPEQSGDDLDEYGFTAAAATKDDDVLSFEDVQVHSFQHLQVAKSLADTAQFDNGGAAVDLGGSFFSGDFRCWGSHFI